MNDLAFDLTIIGGGIAGLAAAYYACKKAPAARILLVEAGSRWGGKITTDRVQTGEGAFIIEGGPDTFLATKPYAVTLCKELGLGERLHGTNPARRSTYVLHSGRLLPLPDGLAMMIPSDIPSILRSDLLGWLDKARMGLDFVLPARPLDGDESLGSFVSRRLGRAAYENLIEPLMSGIYAGDGDALSLAATFPYLRDLELNYGSLARGALAMRKKSTLNSKAPRKALQGSRSAFLTPTTGLAEIVEALVAHLQTSGVVLRLNSPALGLDRASAGYRVRLGSGQVIETGSLILAAPAPASGRLLRTLDPVLGETLQSIPYASTATISLAFRDADLPRPLDGYGYVIPRREERQALACTWTSTKFPHRAPEGFALIRVFVGRAGQEADVPHDQAALLDLARQELRLTLGITAPPVIQRVFVWEEAMPQYNLGHPDKLNQIDAALARQPGLALAGNGYRGIGIPDCIHSGELAAEQALAHLQFVA